MLGSFPNRESVAKYCPKTTLESNKKDDMNTIFHAIEGSNSAFRGWSNNEATMPEAPRISPTVISNVAAESPRKHELKRNLRILLKTSGGVSHLHQLIHINVPMVMPPTKPVTGVKKVETGIVVGDVVSTKCTRESETKTFTVNEIL
jgi:hypothetical protein